MTRQLIALITLWVLGPVTWGADSATVSVAEPMNYTRIYADSAGESRFESLQHIFLLVEFSPHLPPVSSSNPAATSNMVVLSAPAEGVADWHPVPRRQINIILAGEVEIEVSDGEKRRFGPGSYILGEDTSGRGHIARVVGSDDAYFVVVALDEQL